MNAFFFCFVFSFKVCHLLYKDFHWSSEMSLTPKMNIKSHQLLGINSSHNFTFWKPKAHNVDNKIELLLVCGETDFLTWRQEAAIVDKLEWWVYL